MESRLLVRGTDPGLASACVRDPRLLFGGLWASRWFLGDHPLRNLDLSRRVVLQPVTFPSDRWRHRIINCATWNYWKECTRDLMSKVEVPKYDVCSWCAIDFAKRRLR